MTIWRFLIFCFEKLHTRGHCEFTMSPYKSSTHTATLPVMRAIDPPPISARVLPPICAAWPVSGSASSPFPSETGQASRGRGTGGRLATRRLQVLGEAGLRVQSKQGRKSWARSDLSFPREPARPGPGNLLRFELIDQFQVHESHPGEKGKKKHLFQEKKFPMRCGERSFCVCQNSCPPTPL
jgi:hypothetical protein